MMEALPVVYLAAHGETAWTLTGQHNGLTDLPLTERGEADARSLRRLLHGLVFKSVFTSPLQRDYRSCELAGFAAIAEVDSDLHEWNYGAYEGETDAQTRVHNNNWSLFRDGCSNGESPAEVTARADRVISRWRAINDDILIFSSPQFIRALALRWSGFGLASSGKRFAIDIASISAVGYENGLSTPVIRLWNDTRHTMRFAAHKEAAS